jgi:hypothetical protein
MADQMTYQQGDERRGHENNLTHAREVYLSILRSTPKDMLLDELDKVTNEIIDLARGAK